MLQFNKYKNARQDHLIYKIWYCAYFISYNCLIIYLNSDRSLLQMGLEKSFSNADLSGMLDTKDPVYVKDVVHKAKIEIDEKGAKAAASTGKIILFIRYFSNDLSFIVID